MSIFFKKLGELCGELQRELGPFVLFGLFRPEDGRIDRWDLVVSAAWLPEDDIEAWRPFFARLREKLTPEEHLQLSSVEILDPEQPFVRSLSTLQVTGGRVTLPGGQVLGAGARPWEGSGVVIGADWIELPRSVFNNAVFERVVLFSSNPANGPSHRAEQQPSVQAA